MSRRSAAEQVEIDAGVLQRIERAAPGVLRSRAAGWQLRVRTQALEHVGVGVLSLGGVFMLGWPASSMVVFLILSLWLGLLFDALRLVLAPALVREALEDEAREGWFWPALEALRQGRSHYRCVHGDTLPPLLQWLLGVALALWGSGTVAWELSRADGAGWVREVLANPDMLALMGLSLLAQLVAGGLALLRELRGAAAGGAAVHFQPLAEALTWFVLLLLWYGAMPIVVLAGEVFLQRSLAGEGVLVFVACGYALLVARGVAEWRWMRREQLALAWLRARLQARGISLPEG